MRLETTILTNLIEDEEFARKVLPFLDEAYFQHPPEQILYKKIDHFVEKYSNLPSKEALYIELDNDSSLHEDVHKECKEIVSSLEPLEVNNQWLLDQTEKFCKDKAMYNAITEAISIYDGKIKNKSVNNIPDLVADALAVGFDSHIGHDFLEDYERRYEYYHATEQRVSFDLEYFNKITKGGLPRKTLNILMAGTGVGKSLVMCHMAAAALTQGYNVLYITLEMAEEKIAERIDANMLNIPLQDIEKMPKADYETKLMDLKDRTAGKLIIKEYPTAGAGVGHFRHLINDLKLKRAFVPQIIFVDYLNISMSMRVKPGASINTYVYVKAIAEELRGLAVEQNVPIVSATQTTRGGYNNSDPGLEDTSESFGLPATADFMVAIITSDELEALGQIQIKQLKNRYNDIFIHRRFVLGLDRARMKLYDVEQDASMTDTGAVMDNTPFGARLDNEQVRRSGKDLLDKVKTLNFN
jgi:replicative DNA helicase